MAAVYDDLRAVEGKSQWPHGVDPCVPLQGHGREASTKHGCCGRGLFIPYLREILEMISVDHCQLTNSVFIFYAGTADSDGGCRSTSNLFQYQFRANE